MCYFVSAIALGPLNETEDTSTSIAAQKTGGRLFIYYCKGP